MREIKFRGRGKGNDGTWTDWVYGSLDLTDKLPLIYSEMPPEIVEVETIGQYTGLKDDDGTEIYEGDVVSVVPILGVGYRGVVIFNSHTASFEVYREEREDTILLRDDFSMVVIGNIFDNNELKERYGKIWEENQK